MKKNSLTGIIYLQVKKFNDLLNSHNTETI